MTSQLHADFKGYGHIAGTSKLHRNGGLNLVSSQAPYNVLGVATFDTNGLIEEDFTLLNINDMDWVQTSFQAISLQVLLKCYLSLEEFEHTIVHGKNFDIVIVNQKSRYTSLLVSRTTTKDMLDAIIQWARRTSNFHILHPDAG